MSAPLHHDLGRTVQHFGEWYIYSASDRGNLSLIRVDRMNDALRELGDAMRRDAPEVLGKLRQGLAGNALS